MSLRHAWFAILLLVAALVAAPRGQSTSTTQTPSGATIDGTVVDRAGASLPGVTLTLDQNTTTVARTTSDVAGRFRFAGLAQGRYTLRAVLAGFKTSIANVTTPASGTVALRVELQLGAITEEITITAAAPVQDTKQTAAGGRAGYGNAAGIAGGQVAEMSSRTVSSMPPQPASMPMGYGPMRPMPGMPSPSDTETYARIVQNRFTLTTAEPLSTFAADVDTASYTNVRRFLNQGRLPPADAVRVEEFINYFHYRYPEPAGDRPVSITSEVGDAPWAPGHRLVLVGLRAKPIDQRAVGGRNLVLLIDVSGSMSSPDKLPLVKTGLRMFVDNLRDHDRLAIVVYAGASGLVLPSTPARHRERIHDAIESLHAGGSTNGGQGLMLAYKVAGEEFIPGGINRVILATDGDFNVGVTSQGDLLSLIEEKKRSGIFLSVLGVGTGNLKDQTMEMLADKGNGHYAYLDTLHEARRVLVREGGATLETVAKDVKLQVEFNPATVQAWRLIGYENRLLAHQDFNDDRKDGGEMGSGHTVTVLYEVVPVGAPLPAEMNSDPGRPAVDPLVYQSDRRLTGRGDGDLMQVKVRYKKPDEDVSSLILQAVRVGGATRELPFAAAVAEFGLLLRDQAAPEARWTALVARLAKIAAPAGDAAERQGFAELVELAAGLRRLTGAEKRER